MPQLPCRRSRSGIMLKWEDVRGSDRYPLSHLQLTVPGQDSATLSHQEWKKGLG